MEVIDSAEVGLRLQWGLVALIELLEFDLAELPKPGLAVFAEAG